MWKGINGDVAWTLDGHYYLGCGSRGGREREVVYGVDMENEKAWSVGNGQLDQLKMSKLVGALNCMHDQQAIMQIRGGGSMDEPTYMSDRKGHNSITEDGTATTLTAQEKERPLIGHSVVRRLTPIETERLQQFPDDWSKYGINEKGCVYELPDSARYKLQGNSIARPFWSWLLRRIAAQYEGTVTLGSLFDGQGGFPLCGLECGIKTLWASEIEKHAIAVTRYHFGDEDMGIKGDLE